MKQIVSLLTHKSVLDVLKLTSLIIESDCLLLKGEIAYKSSRFSIMTWMTWKEVKETWKGKFDCIFKNIAEHIFKQMSDLH